MKLLGIVVLYRPGEEVGRNLSTYLPEVDRLIVWDNTPGATAGDAIPGHAGSSKIVRMTTGSNTGIGTPLNEAVRYGLEYGFTHLLTMDQDSAFPPGELARYKAAVEAADTGDTACYGVRLSDRATADEASGPAGSGELPVPREVDMNITSGSLYPLAVFRHTGLFRADFFIDAVDNEFCFRAARKDWKIKRFDGFRLFHTLGYARTVPFLWGKLFLLDYSPMRTYYIIRNHLIVRRLYRPERHYRLFVRDQLVFRLIGIVLKEDRKIQKIKAICLGLYHGWRNKTGICSRFGC